MLKNHFWRVIKKWLTIIFIASCGWLFAQNNALDFDGTDDYVSIPDTAAHKPDSVTVEAWVYIDEESSTKIPINEDHGL